MHLMNGNTTVRTRTSDGCEVLPCGCAHTALEWHQLCDEHFAQWSLWHVQAHHIHIDQTRSEIEGAK